jgi:hypothetical protein
VLRPSSLTSGPPVLLRLDRVDHPDVLVVADLPKLLAFKNFDHVVTSIW